MQSIKREQELSGVIDRVRERAQLTAGNLVTGIISSPVHISVVSPPRGGLSIFLEDIKDELEVMASCLPVRIQFESTDKWLDLLSAELRKVAEVTGVTAPPQYSIDDLFELAKAIANNGRLLVLIIDAGKAIASIEGDENWRGRESQNTFLQWLRSLVTRATDQEPPLATVVGWRTEFLEASRGWQCHDVVQRYFPSIPLYSDFQLTDAWPVYEAILKDKSIRVENGPFPGFPRTQIPIGSLVDATRNDFIDQNSLLLLMRQTRAFGSITQGIPDDLLIRLCLKDGLISLDDPILANDPLKARLRQTTNPTENGLIANDLLYSALGMHPPQYRASLIQQLGTRFQERDPTLAYDVLEMMGKALAIRGGYVPENCGSYSKLTLSLPASLRPPGSSRVSVDIFCSLERQVPKELLEVLFEELEKIEQNSESMTSRLLLVACGDPTTEENIKKPLAEHAIKTEGRWTPVGTGRRAVAACVGSLSMDELEDLAITSMGGSAVRANAAPQFLDRVLSDHYKLVLPPPVLSEDLDAFGASEIVTRPFEIIRRSSLVGNLSLEASTRLIRAGILTKQVSAQVSWDPTEDKFLNALSKCQPAADPYLVVAKRFWIDREAWNTLVASAAEAYSSSYLRVSPGRPEEILTPAALGTRLTAIQVEITEASQSLPVEDRQPFTDQVIQLQGLGITGNLDETRLKEGILAGQKAISRIQLLIEERAQERTQLEGEIHKLITDLGTRTTLDYELQRRKEDLLRSTMEHLRGTSTASSLKTCRDQLKALGRVFDQNLQQSKATEIQINRIDILLRNIESRISRNDSENPSIQTRLKSIQESVHNLRTILESARVEQSDTQAQADAVKDLDNQVVSLELKLKDAERRASTLMKPTHPTTPRNTESSAGNGGIQSTHTTTTRAEKVSPTSTDEEDPTALGISVTKEPPSNLPIQAGPNDEISSPTDLLAHSTPNHPIDSTEPDDPVSGSSNENEGVSFPDQRVPPPLPIPDSPLANNPPMSENLPSPDSAPREVIHESHTFDNSENGVYELVQFLRRDPKIFDFKIE